MSLKLNKKLKITSANDIKTEDDLKSMTFYIDDRLELVKQIFSTLKPKTIKNLSPEFLKESTIEHIKEMCLNELLGISSKRLKSVILATKCPTDTESSDSNVDENISLEEISTDTDEENDAKRKKANKFGRTEKDKNEKNAKTENGKEISVLELLELQARARAIRSQLALEPIAKVELDDSEDSTKKSTVKMSTEKKLVSQKYSINHSNFSKFDSNMCSIYDIGENQEFTKNGSTQILNQSNSVSKPIKLKRNYTKPLSESSLMTCSNSSKNNIYLEVTEQKLSFTDKSHSTSNKNKNESKVLKKTKEKKNNRLKKKLNVSQCNKRLNENNSERSQSPDVLAILNSPEILCVSDSSNDEDTVKIKAEKINESDTEIDSSSSASSNTSLSSEDSDSEYSVELKTNSEKLEDLRKLIQRKKIKDKEGDKIDSLNENNEQKQDKKIIESTSHHSASKSGNPINTTEKIAKNPELKGQSCSISKSQEKMSIDLSVVEKSEENSVPNFENKCSDEIILKKDVVNCEICKEESIKSHEPNSKIQGKLDDDQHNDDAISLGDAELDYGITEHLSHEERTNTNIDIPDTPLSPEVNQSEPEDTKDANSDGRSYNDKSDFINLHDSSGEDISNENNSWNDRWLKSSKVSKILAASKLGNKVRHKAKRSKKAEKEQQQIFTHKEKPAINMYKNMLLSNIEEGSVKQYEKIKENIKSPKK